MVVSPLVNAQTELNWTEEFVGIKLPKKISYNILEVLGGLIISNRVF